MEKRYLDLPAQDEHVLFKLITTVKLLSIAHVWYSLIHPFNNVFTSPAYCPCIYWTSQINDMICYNLFAVMTT